MDKKTPQKTTITIFLILLISSAPILPLASRPMNNRSLINKDFIKKNLTFEAPWADSHGATGDDLGAGMLYYALVYIKKAKLCVCLGSGGGFVPRVMRQAQRDLNLHEARTVLVDGNMGPWGRPFWLNENSFFRKNYPDIEIIIDTTSHVARDHGPSWLIDYLHIDADHSIEGAYQDFMDYLPLMARDGIITFHDTNGSLPCAEVIPMIRNLGFDVIDFKNLGAGVAIIYLNKDGP